MSANSVKGTHYMNNMGGMNSQATNLSNHQKNQILAAQGIINKTLSTGSMLGPT